MKRSDLSQSRDVCDGVVDALCALYDSYGYSKYKMSKFEEYDLYANNKDFLISGSVITFTDADGRLLALKPDVTLSIIKNCDTFEGFTQKLYYNEKVYRPKAVSRSFCEITQTGLECIGEIDLYTVCEVLSLAAKSLEKTGKEYVLDVGHVGILTEAFDACGIEKGKRPAFARLIGEKNLHELRALCSDSGISESDFSRLSLFITEYGDPKKTLSVIKRAFKNSIKGDLFEELEKETGIDGGKGGKIRIDFSVATDTKYYNGIVFKGYIKGVSETALSGGRYGKLVRSMGKNADALGFAVYVDEIVKLLSVPKPFDCDVALLYDCETPLELVRSESERYRKEYGRVIAERFLHGQYRAAKVVDLRGKGGKK